MSLKVLLADDSMTAQNMGKKILTDAGYQVIAVSNGAQALKKLASEKPDLVVLDVYMPGYSGLEVCERIKNAPDTARIPVVLCVAKMEPFKPEEGTRVRADAVIVKPFEATDLVSRIQELGERVQRRPKQQKVQQEETGDVEATEAVEPRPHVDHVNVPQELAVEPAIGMELVTEEAPTPMESSASSAPSFPATFEIEHERQPTETIGDVRMQSADGLSGVFEMPPSKPSPGNAVPEFEIVSQPASEESASSADEVHGHAAAAARVEPRPEFVVDRVSISIPLKESERRQESQLPSEPFVPPAVKNSAEPMAPTSTTPETPSFVEPAKPSMGSGYTGIYEFAPPRGSLEAPTVETRAGDMRSSGMTDLVEPMVSASQPFSAEMESVGSVAVETDVRNEETVTAVPLPVWVAEEVALDQCELHISLEDEMRGALESASGEHVEVPLGVAAERIAAFTTEQPIHEVQTPEEAHSENFAALPDDIICDAAAAHTRSGSQDSRTGMPESQAMDEIASLQNAVPGFSSEGTLPPDFSIPGHSFEGVPADDFGPPMATGMVIESTTIEDEPITSEMAAEVPQEIEASSAQSERLQPESVPADQPEHPLGAIAQAIVDSPALSSLKGKEAAPIVEAIVSRMLEQIKPELVAHVLRELEKK